MFVGRSEELATLERLYAKGGFQMVVVYGRRRVGKTALVSEFARGKRTLFFTALDQADKDNLTDFSRAVYAFFGLPDSTGPFASWSSAFDFIAERATRERFVFVFDELPYAAGRNASIPSALQIAIDRKLKDTGLFLVLCGSNQGFMESEVLGSKSPLYGRRTAQMRIEQLGYREAALMLPGLGAQELFRYYGCFGGVPYYLEQLDLDASLEQNIADLYFNASGFLYDEPYGLLRQEFKEPALYSSILRAIASGANRPNLIADRIGVEQTTLPKYLRALISLGVIEKAVPFGENPEKSKRGIYRICDACYNFWFHFVMPRTSEIEQGLGAIAAQRIMGSNLDEYLGHRFERLCLEWLTQEAKTGALPVAATRLGSWWGTNPTRREQTDIDVLAADPDTKQMLIGECKYREKFDEASALDGLVSKRGLVSGYHATDLYLFTKHSVGAKTSEICSERRDVHFVALEQMYE